MTITTYPYSARAHTCLSQFKSSDLQHSDSTPFTPTLISSHPFLWSLDKMPINSSTPSKNPEFSYSFPPSWHSQDQIQALDNTQKSGFAVLATEDDKKAETTQLFSPYFMITIAKWAMDTANCLLDNCLSQSNLARKIN